MNATVGFESTIFTGIFSYKKCESVKKQKENAVVDLRSPWMNNDEDDDDDDDDPLGMQWTVLAISAATVFI